MAVKAIVATGVLLAATTPTLANVNVEFRTVEDSVAVGGTANVGVYLVSDSDSDQYVASAEIVFTWEPQYLQLLGVDTTGGPPLMGFPPFPDNLPLNESDPPQDGDGMYIALAYGGVPVEAPPQGTLLTTFQFEAMAETSGTLVDVVASLSNPPGTTVIWDGTIPNYPVTGTLTGDVVVVGDEVGGETCRSDVDGDGEVGVADFLDILAAWGAAGSVAADIDGDGLVGVGDFLQLLSDWGPCP
ncbi:MAG: EF-hand domain-containing protein [Planctomycetota bacterium]